MKLAAVAPGCLLCLAALAGGPARAQAPAAPFPPSYYAEALTLEGEALRFVSRRERDGVQHATYVSGDGGIHVSVEQAACEPPQCELVYERILKDHAALLESASGEFRAVSSLDFAARWNAGQAQYLVLAARTPRATVFWVRTQRSPRELDDAAFLEGLRAVLDHQRADEALTLGNVEAARWAPSMHRHARALLQQGRRDEALALLREVLAWSPNHFEAQLDFAENTPDAAAARASALAVWENAEAPFLAARAARLLGRGIADTDSLPQLAAGLRGLRVVLMPVPPCDLRLLDEAGRLVAASLDVPVSLARLPAGWAWDAPERFFGQNEMQVLIQRKLGQPVDFDDWTPERHAYVLREIMADDDALTRYRVQAFVDHAAGQPGQYRAGKYVERLLIALRPLRSDDRRTLYVGVTGADIFDGDANFLFSSAQPRDGEWAALASYARMQASFLNEPYPSRRRLAERLAKELVPAALKQLDIPRAADPADPYSYSEGVERLAQKTLTLSAPTREALDRLR